MTTIVGDWRRKIIVSDSQYSDDDTGLKYFENKVYKVKDGWFGGAGTQSDIEKAMQWFFGDKKRKPKLKDSNSFLFLNKNGLYSCDNSLEWETVRTFMAIGSGAMAAEVLMRQGQKAELAVLGACNVDLYSSPPIKVFALGKSTGQEWEK